MRAELTRAVTNRPLLGLCGATVLAVAAYFAVYTYITLFSGRYAGIDGTGISILIFFFGAAGVIGVVLAGRLVDRRPRASTLTFVAALVLALAGVGLSRHGAAPVFIAAIVLLGGAFTAVPVLLQAAVLRVARQGADTASSLYVVAFQIGIALGSLAGGQALSHGAVDVLSWAAAPAHRRCLRTIAAVLADLRHLRMGQRAIQTLTQLLVSESGTAYRWSQCRPKDRPGLPWTTSCLGNPFGHGVQLEP